MPDESCTTGRVRKDDLFSSLPPEWPGDPWRIVRSRLTADGAKVVVLDDDPTGTQTVHGVPVLTEWSVESLVAELSGDAPAFYILTNSRAMPLPAAQALNAEIGRNLAEAAHRAATPKEATPAPYRRFAVVSRGDSTLRGHYPGEVDVLADALGGGFTATLLIPAFFEGGRFTVGNIHYVAEVDWLVPAAQTDFARDSAFGYSQSDLIRWVEEKTSGRIPAESVAAISLDDIRIGGPERIAEILQSLPSGSVCIVNAASYDDLAVFTIGLLDAEARGRRFLYRTAASFARVRAGIDPKPLLTARDMALPGDGGALIVIGSYVAKTSTQIEGLLRLPGLVAVEVDVAALLADDRREHEISRVAAKADEALLLDRDAAIYTSRNLVSVDDAAGSLSIGKRISNSLLEIVRRIETRPRYVLAKGGITSSDIATQGLNVRRAMVLGQAIPGVPAWRLGPESRHPGLAYIVFPGNVGGPDALADVVAGLRKTRKPDDGS
jgi:uncharacterized protein YgbK (DUF1537 family)